MLKETLAANQGIGSQLDTLAGQLGYLGDKAEGMFPESARRRKTSRELGGRARTAGSHRSSRSSYTDKLVGYN